MKKMMTSLKQVRTQTQSREDKKLGEILIDHCGFEGESFGRVDEEIVFVFGSEVSRSLMGAGGELDVSWTVR